MYIIIYYICIYISPNPNLNLDHQIIRSCGTPKNKPPAILPWMALNNPQMVVVYGIGFTTLRII